MKAFLTIIAALLIGCCIANRSDEATCRAADECDPEAAYSDKAACDDGDPATADRCVDGCSAVCAHVRVQCDGYDAPDVQAARCDDGNPCTADRCDVSACAHSPVGGCAF